MLKQLNTPTHIERCKKTVRLVSKRVEGEFLIVEGEYDSPVTELVDPEVWPEQCRKGYVVPDAFTHGTSEQRVRWFRLGFESGDYDQGDTFSAQRL